MLRTRGTLQGAISGQRRFDELLLPLGVRMKRAVLGMISFMAGIRLSGIALVTSEDRRRVLDARAVDVVKPPTRCGTRRIGERHRISVRVGIALPALRIDKVHYWIKRDEASDDGVVLAGTQMGEAGGVGDAVDEAAGGGPGGLAAAGVAGLEDQPTGGGAYRAAGAEAGGGGAAQRVPADLGVPEVEGGAVGVFADEPVAGRVVEVAGGAGAGSDRREVAFRVPGQRLDGLACDVAAGGVAHRVIAVAVGAGRCAAGGHRLQGVRLCAAGRRVGVAAGGVAS